MYPSRWDEGRLIELDQRTCQNLSQRTVGGVIKHIDNVNG